MSTLILIPLALAIEGTKMFKSFGDVVAFGENTRKGLATLLALGGATYYAIKKEQQETPITLMNTINSQKLMNQM